MCTDLCNICILGLRFVIEACRTRELSAEQKFTGHWRKQVPQCAGIFKSFGSLVPGKNGTEIWGYALPGDFEIPPF